MIGEGRTLRKSRFSQPIGDIMKTTAKLICIVLFTFLFFTVNQAKTIEIIDFGAVPDDNRDDTRAVKKAVDKLRSFGGGTLIFPSGTTDINDEIRFHLTGNYQSYLLKGDRGAFIRLNGGSNTNYFSFGNVNQVEFDGLIFYAPNTPVVNAQRVIVSSYVIQTRITNCSFFGIGASVAIVNAQNTDLIVDKTQFEGSAAYQGVIYANTSRGITVTNTTFFDYANFLDMFLTKTPYIISGAWVNVENENPSFGGDGQRVVRIKDSRFDEGALKTIRITNQKTAEISGINVNVSGITGSGGIRLENVEYAEIKKSIFGYTTNQRPAIELYNGSFIEVTALTFNDGVFFLESDETSNHVKRHCPDCQDN